MEDDRIKEAKKRLADINKTISSLDPSIRAAAFELLAPLYFEDYESVSPKIEDEKSKSKPIRSSSSSSAEEFFNQHDHDQAKDNVHLVAAWLYSQYGVTPLSQKDIRDCADDAGLTIPQRPDNTMRSAKKDAKNLYRQKGGGWQLTVKGEAYLRDTYKVRKGNKTRPTGDNG